MLLERFSTCSFYSSPSLRFFKARKVSFLSFPLVPGQLWILLLPVRSQWKRPMRKLEDILMQFFLQWRFFSLLKTMVVPGTFQPTKSVSLQMPLKMLWILACGSLFTQSLRYVWLQTWQEHWHRAGLPEQPYPQAGISNLCTSFSHP